MHASINVRLSWLTNYLEFSGPPFHVFTRPAIDQRADKISVRIPTPRSMHTRSACFSNLRDRLGNYYQENCGKGKEEKIMYPAR